MLAIQDAIKNAYEIYERLNISVTSLVVLALLLSLAFLFAVREAAAWFFKVDDLKRDVRRLREISTRLEGEIHVLQNLLSQAKQTSITDSAEPKSGRAPDASPAPSEAKTSPGFPVVH